MNYTLTPVRFVCESCGWVHAVYEGYASFGCCAAALARGVRPITAVGVDL